jgi:hypothetical protein
MVTDALAEAARRQTGKMRSSGMSTPIAPMRSGTGLRRTLPIARTTRRMGGRPNRVIPAEARCLIRMATRRLGQDRHIPSTVRLARVRSGPRNTPPVLAAAPILAVFTTVPMDLGPSGPRRTASTSTLTLATSSNCSTAGLARMRCTPRLKRRCSMLWLAWSACEHCRQLRRPPRTRANRPTAVKAEVCLHDRINQIHQGAAVCCKP